MPASSVDPRVLVGVPSYRRPEGLRNLLLSLAAQERVDDISIEVFVADNDPQKREAKAVCAEIASTFRWLLTCEVVDERGISAARNAIVDEARARGADMLAMIDDDEVPGASWVRELVSTLQRTGADLVGGPVYAQFGDVPRRAFASSELFGLRNRRDGETLEGTGNVLISCRSLASVGWPRFDSAFGLTGGEDKEYFTRLRKLGLRFAWSEAAIARECVPSSRANLRWLLRRAFRVGNNDLRIEFLHGKRRRVLISIMKAVAVLGVAPICVPILIAPSWRVSLLAKWARSAGKITAVFGAAHRDYGTRSSSGAPT
jgi:GT2 family glycosyltransferase